MRLEMVPTESLEIDSESVRISSRGVPGTPRQMHLILGGSRTKCPPLICPRTEVPLAQRLHWRPKTIGATSRVFLAGSLKVSK
jgi:hypothetical protein